MRCAEIRRRFVDYYHNLGFQLLPRAPMLHPSIPMSFVMSAGLVQVETSLANAKNRSGNKFVLVQDCFRHFDLGAIGKDNMHLSMFEMPGAFVFGPDGRHEAIQRMWTLATERLGIPAERLWATYFSGDFLGEEGLPRDEVTFQTWKKVGIAHTHLVGLGLQDNYWIQGGSVKHTQSSFRKCGPNTELFYDLGPEHACGPTCLPGCPCGNRFLEFSNSLFISFNIDSGTQELLPLEDPFTETVIGSERVAMILQGATSVFDTASYTPLIHAIHTFVPPTNLPPAVVQESVRVLADHAKAVYILVADQAPPPGKNGRERIMKQLIRAMLTRQKLLGISAPEFFEALFHAVVKSIRYGNGQHSLSTETLETVHDYLNSQASPFRKTIARGLRKLDAMLVESDAKTLSGTEILSLEKNWGLPLPLTVDALRKKGLEFKEDDYQKALDFWRKTL